VIDDKYVTPSDALMVINDLNRNGARTLPVDRPRPLTGPFLDASRDGRISPLDALTVINYLNGRVQGAGEGEGEATATGHVSDVRPAENPLRAGCATRVAGHSRLSDQDDANQVGADQVGANAKSEGHWATLDLLFARYDETSATRDFDTAAGRRRGQVMDLEEFLDRVLGKES
jgi:hypothetical protein